MKITVIGVVPPCPRCKHMYDLAGEAAEELGLEVAMNKIAYDGDGVQKYGKVGTAHHIAEWTGMEVIGAVIASVGAQTVKEFPEYSEEARELGKKICEQVKNQNN